MLTALYYPFSRCMSTTALKQLILVFDSVTFLDPVEDEEYRAHLFADLEIIADRRFARYREMKGPMNVLRHEGAIVLKSPHELGAFTSEEVVASAISDLMDEEWTAVASRPERFNLPFQANHSDGRATWETFGTKIPTPLRELLLDRMELQPHVIWAGDLETTWMVSYEAGSAAALNLHLAAAGELALAPVTDSRLHHRLLLRKLARSLGNDPDWARPNVTSVVELMARQTALDLVERLLPRSALESASLEAILKFRERTRSARAALMDELTQQFARVTRVESAVEMLDAQARVSQALEKELKEYRNQLASVRDALWPGLINPATSGLAAGSAAAIMLQWLASGTLGILAGSIAGASLTLLKSSLQHRAELRKITRGSPGVAYLSQVLDA